MTTPPTTPPAALHEENARLLETYDRAHSPGALAPAGPFEGHIASALARTDEKLKADEALLKGVAENLRKKAGILFNSDKGMSQSCDELAGIIERSLTESALAMGGKENGK